MREFWWATIRLSAFVGFIVLVFGFPELMLTPREWTVTEIVSVAYLISLLRRPPTYIVQFWKDGDDGD